MIPVEKGKKYYFSAWIKTEGKPANITILWLHQGDSHLKGKLMYLSGEAEGPWRKYVVPEITTIENQLTIFLMSDGAGTIWFDDIVLRKIDEAVAQPEVPKPLIEPVKKESENLISNPGFEDGQKGWSYDLQRGKYEFTLDQAEAHGGSASAKLLCVEPGRAMLWNSVPAEKGKKYYFSVWVKAVGKPAGTTIVWLHQGSTPATHRLLFLDADAEGKWRQYVIPEMPAIEDSIPISLMGDDKGTIWFDDVVMRKIGD